MDGDGDQDIVTSAYGDVNNPTKPSEIAWYENTTGDGSRFQAHSVSKDVAGAESVFAADLDNDGDVDILSASNLDNKFAWYENTNGNGLTFVPHTINASGNRAESISAVDVDGGGDLDVLTATFYDNKISWYENTTGDASQLTEHIMSTSARWAESVVGADVDGDGDVDVLSASGFDNRIAWYENVDGDGTAFAQPLRRRLESRLQLDRHMDF